MFLLITDINSRSTDNMGRTIPALLTMLKENSGDVVFNPKFFEERDAKAINDTLKIRAVKPIIQYAEEKVKLQYNVSTRGNGRDQPRWPQDLSVEVVE